MPSIEKTNSILWWVLGFLGTILTLGGVFYLNFLATAMDDIRSSMSDIQLAMTKIEASALARTDVIDLIELKTLDRAEIVELVRAQVEYPWKQDGPKVLFQLEQHEARIAQLESTGN